MLLDSGTTAPGDEKPNYYYKCKGMNTHCEKNREKNVYLHFSVADLPNIFSHCFMFSFSTCVCSNLMLFSPEKLFSQSNESPVSDNKRPIF